MLYISTKFCDIISNGIKVIELIQFLYWKIQRGIIPPKMQVHEIILNGIKVIERTRFLYGKLQRGIIPQKM